MALRGTARLVLNATNPPTITADVTVCSPRPYALRSMNQPDLPDPGRTSDVAHDVVAVKSLIAVELSRSALAVDVRSSTNI